MRARAITLLPVFLSAFAWSQDAAIRISDRRTVELQDVPKSNGWRVTSGSTFQLRMLASKAANGTQHVDFSDFRWKSLTPSLVRVESSGANAFKALEPGTAILEGAYSTVVEGRLLPVPFTIVIEVLPLRSLELVGLDGFDMTMRGGKPILMAGLDARAKVVARRAAVGTVGSKSTSATVPQPVRQQEEQETTPEATGWPIRIYSSNPAVLRLLPHEGAARGDILVPAGDTLRLSPVGEGSVTVTVEGGGKTTTYDLEVVDPQLSIEGVPDKWRDGEAASAKLVAKSKSHPKHKFHVTGGKLTLTQGGKDTEGLSLKGSKGAYSLKATARVSLEADSPFRDRSVEARGIVLQKPVRIDISPNIKIIEGDTVEVPFDVLDAQGNPIQDLDLDDLQLDPAPTGRLTNPRLGLREDGQPVLYLKGGILGASQAPSEEVAKEVLSNWKKFLKNDRASLRSDPGPVAEVGPPAGPRAEETFSIKAGSASQTVSVSVQPPLHMSITSAWSGPIADLLGPQVKKEFLVYQVTFTNRLGGVSGRDISGKDILVFGNTLGLDMVLHRKKGRSDAQKVAAWFKMAPAQTSLDEIANFNSDEAAFRDFILGVGDQTTGYRHLAPFLYEEYAKTIDIRNTRRSEDRFMRTYQYLTLLGTFLNAAPTVTEYLFRQLGQGVDGPEFFGNENLFNSVRTALDVAVNGVLGTLTARRDAGAKAANDPMMILGGLLRVTPGKPETRYVLIPRSSLIGFAGDVRVVSVLPTNLSVRFSLTQAESTARVATQSSGGS